MNVRVNGEEHSFEVGTISVTDLLSHIGVEQLTGIAVALNAEVVPNSEWSTTAVGDGDAIEIVRATQGG